jgi:hypothetical protein
MKENAPQNGDWEINYFSNVYFLCFDFQDINLRHVFRKKQKKI